MKKKLFSRLLCASLAVLMTVCILPVLPLKTSAATTISDNVDYTKVIYDTEADRLAAMQKFYDNGEYALYCDTTLGIVAYQKIATGEVLFTNPWNMNAEKNGDSVVRANLMSQIMLEYVNSENQSLALNSYADAALKGQISVKNIKNGLRVEYAIGQRSSRTLCPMQIERTAFEEKILKPLEAAVGKGLTNRELTQFKAYFNLQAYKTANDNKKKAIAIAYPVCEKKNIDIYVLNTTTSSAEMRKLEAKILAFCTGYSFEEMDNDYDFVEYEETATSPPVFKMALEYTISGNGLQVALPANGLRYDETVYRITKFQILPYMGASLSTNEGYSFVPDGSGALYELSSQTLTPFRVYGEDYALFSNVSGYHNETMRMPVFGQVETVFTPKLISPTEFDADGNKSRVAVYSESEGVTAKRGVLGISEEGESLATIAPNHVSYMSYRSVGASFVTRQNDTSKSKWTVYASRRYTGDYRIRYILLSDDTKAQKAELSDYYECSWMGMACAYRDYIAANKETYTRLGEARTKSSIPLYIETFGCVDTVKKVLSMPVTVSVALTSFDDIATMYDYLAGAGISNVNFKLSGYANGGMYSDVPYKLKWERSVGGKSGFKDLVKYAEEKGFGIYPDFDFVYTKMGDGGNAVKLKKNASRTIDNRYTTKRTYSATQQTLVSYYQMVLSPATYSKFYEKLAKKYGKYDIDTISLATFGSALNSDYDAEKTVLREEAKEYVTTALTFFKDKNYSLMLEGGNAFTWSYADHILNVPLDSSRYNMEYRSVPFMGVVLHGYVEFAGSALNMEGNLSYAMLKAMENGASIYFILSYANTELLKEDELLSQNYSVRYDIWQSQLVEIYKELNAVLADVQTKLIIDHQFLEGSRVPEQNELLQDIADAMEEKKKELEEKIEADRIAAILLIRTASDAVSGGAGKLATQISVVQGQMEMLQELRISATPADNNWLYRAWADYRAEAAKADDDVTKNLSGAIATLRNRLDSYLAMPMAQITAALRSAAENLSDAKAGYNTLLGCNADAQVLADARADFITALDRFAELYGVYYGTTGTFTEATKEAYIAGNIETTDALLAGLVLADTATDVEDADLEAFLFGNDETIEAKYPVLGAAQLERAFLNMLIREGLYNEADPEGSAINYAALYQGRLDDITRPPEPEPDPVEPGPTEPGEGDDEDVVIPDPPKSKYSIDNALVMVTYGEKNAPYKSLILNFNDYAVQTTVNGVTYTIKGYGYVVIYY
mgnify:CR=1 FL=1